MTIASCHGIREGGVVLQRKWIALAVNNQALVYFGNGCTRRVGVYI
jgi:hypothetical protein